MSAPEQPAPDQRPLTVPLPLGSSAFRPALLFVVLVAVLWGTDALIDPTPGTLVRWAGRRAVASLAFAIALALLAGWVLSFLGRRWLTVNMRGFVVSGWWGQTAVADEEVTALTQQCELDAESRWKVRL